MTSPTRVSTTRASTRTRSARTPGATGKRSAKSRRRRATDSTRAPGSGTREDAARDAAFRCIRALVAALQTSARAVEQRTGLTNAQLFLLRHVVDAGSVTVNDLAERSRAGQSAVSIVVAKLVRDGHVRRGRVAGDARRVALTATARGRAVLRRAPRPATERLLDAIAAITPREARALSRSIGILLEELGTKPTTAPLLFEPVRGRGR